MTPALPLCVRTRRARRGTAIPPHDKTCELEPPMNKLRALSDKDLLGVSGGATGIVSENPVGAADDMMRRANVPPIVALHVRLSSAAAFFDAVERNYEVEHNGQHNPSL